MDKATKEDIEKVWVTKARFKAVVLFNIHLGSRLGYIILPKWKTLDTEITEELEVQGRVNLIDCVSYSNHFYPTFDKEDVGKFVVGVGYRYSDDFTVVAEFNDRGIKSLKDITNECEELAEQLKGAVSK